VAIATAVVLLINLLRYFEFAVLHQGFPSSFTNSVIRGCGDEISQAFITAWVILALSRRLSLEKSWIDRTGRVFGILWILLYWCGWWDLYYHE
jgi:hypothetical protein